MKFDPMEKAMSYAGVFTDFPQKTPTKGEPDGPLFGNGDIGVVAGGTGDALTFWIGKNDFWQASYTPVDGHVAGGVKGLGALRILSPELQSAAFSAQQEIGTADVSIALETPEKRLAVSAYAPYGQGCVVWEIQAERGDIPLKIALEPMADPDAECASSAEKGLLVMTKAYIKEVEWETKAAAFCRLLGWEQPEGILRLGESLTLALFLQTNHDSPDYLAQARKKAESVSQGELDRYRRNHLSWWRGFWQSSGISIPSEPELEKFWYASHYLMASCCQAGKFAPGIFGNWITTNDPNWQGDYHLNYNYQAPWWGAFSSNKVGLAEPYDQPLLDYIPKAKENAKERLGQTGLYAKVGIGPKGFESSRMYGKDGTENLDLPYWGQKSNGVYATVNMLMRFYATYDEDYAKKCMPFLLETADFWEGYLKFEDGRYVIYNDCIHENGYAAKGVFDWAEEGEDHSGDFNPILTLGLLRGLFRGLLDISEVLGENESRREKWAHILAHLSDFPLQEREGKTVFRYTERGMAWNDGNSLGVQHIFPAGAIGLSSDEKLLQIARDTISVMGRWSDYNAFPTFFTAAARVGYDPKIILTKFKEQFMGHSFPNLFIYYGGGGIECCSAVPSCVNEMLFQSHQGLLRFFPVWEREKDAAFENLRAYGAFLVSAELKNGEVGEISLTSEKGRPCSIFCPWESGMTVLEEGKPVPCQTEKIRDGQVYTFATKPGALYRIVPSQN